MPFELVVPVTSLPLTTYLPCILFSSPSIKLLLQYLEELDYQLVMNNQHASLSHTRRKKELYGEVTTSSFSEGNTDAVKRNTSGKLSYKMLSIKDPKPDPVPPPRE